MDLDNLATVDPKEISHFTSLSHDWWNTMGLTMCLHSMNMLRVPLVRDGLVKANDASNSSKPLKGLLILDVGCGGGIQTEALAKLGCTIVGIDVCSDLIDQAKAHAALDPSLTNLTYLLESVEDHALLNCEKYDAVVASEVLEHVSDKDTILESCAKCLKPGGSIFITTFNRNTLSWLVGIVAYEWVLRCIPRGTHSWDKFISPEDVTNLLKKHKCQTKVVRGMIYNFLTNTWFWSSFSGVYYALQAIKD